MGGRIMKMKGFTLIEIVLAVSLMAILFALSATTLDRGIASFGTIMNRGSQGQNAYFAMERMMREILLIEAGSGGDLTNLQTSQINFQDSLGINTDFRLDAQTQTLYRSNDPLLTRVTGLTFTGYNSTGALTQATPQIRRIRIQLTSLPEGETTALTLRTDVFLRSEMYENFQ